jgi:hypothetical protein
LRIVSISKANDFAVVVSDPVFGQDCPLGIATNIPNGKPGIHSARSCRMGSRRCYSGFKS